MNSFIETISNSWFVLGLVKATLVALAGGAFILCVRQRDLAAKLWAVLAVLLPLALFSGALPLSWKALPRVEAVKTARLEFVPLPLAAGRPAQAPATPLHEESTGLPVTGDEAGLSEAAAAPVITPRPSLSRDHLLILFWIAGGAATLLPGLLALLASRRLQRSAPPAEIVNLWREVAGKAAAPAPVRISRDVATPGIASVFFPEVLLPAAALEWEEERLLSVLRHEFHHIRRGDARLRWLGRVARSLLWFHPMAWWVQSRLVIAQERAADDAVIAAGIPAPEYAGHLLALASNARAFPGIAMARRSQVGRRIRTMLSPRPDLSPRRAGFERILTVVMSAVVVPAALIGFSGPETALAEEAAMIDDTGFRGPIVDRNGVLLATSNPARMPEEIRSKPPIRWYPEGAAFAHVAGFVIPNARGEVTDGKGAALESSASLAKGQTLKLTLDARIQRLAAQALAVRQLPGALMVIDPNTGDVLAMASWPTFDPNLFADGIASGEWETLSTDKGNPLFNRASHSVAPGSFGKLLTALAAAKADKADRVMHCGPNVSLGTAKFRDWNSERNEPLDLTSALATSCNTYFIPLAWEMGGETLASIATDLELGPGAGSPWPWRATWPSRPEPEEDLTRVDLAMTAIGQGWTSLALIDMARVMSAVASGEIRPARFTEADPASHPLALADLGIDARELAMIRQGLIDAVNGPRGVTKRAGLEGVTVAGKSATTQIGRGGHAATFTGYVPAEKPRFVVSAIFVREGPPSGQGDGVSGGTTAAPVVAELMKALLDAGY
jgi:beta-lactamase regulating signal transducer with metallopeptidase domain